MSQMFKENMPFLVFYIPYSAVTPLLKQKFGYQGHSFLFTLPFSVLQCTMTSDSYTTSFHIIQSGPLLWCLNPGMSTLLSNSILELLRVIGNDCWPSAESERSERTPDPNSSLPGHSVSGVGSHRNPQTFLGGSTSGSLQIGWVLS